MPDYRFRTSGLASETLMWLNLMAEDFWEPVSNCWFGEGGVRAFLSIWIHSGRRWLCLTKTGRSQVVLALRRLEGSRLKRWWTPLGVTDLTLTCSFSEYAHPWFISSEIKMSQGNHYGKKVRIRQHCSCKGARWSSSWLSLQAFNWNERSESEQMAHQVMYFYVSVVFQIVENPVLFHSSYQPHWTTLSDWICFLSISLCCPPNV